MRQPNSKANNGAGQANGVGGDSPGMAHQNAGAAAASLTASEDGSVQPDIADPLAAEPAASARNFLTAAQWSVGDDWLSEQQPSPADESAFVRWQAVFKSLDAEFQRGAGGVDELGFNPGFAELMRGGLSQNSPLGADLSLMPQGQQLKAFEGLREGLANLN